MSASGDNAITIPVAILVNSRTSGPAELMAVSLRDGLGSAWVIGSSTAGNAELSEIFDLYDSTAIGIPVATLSTTHTSFSGTGVQPDYEIAMAADTPADLIKLDENTDACIKKAIEVISQTAN